MGVGLVGEPPPNVCVFEHWYVCVFLYLYVFCVLGSAGGKVKVPKVVRLAHTSGGGDGARGHSTRVLAALVPEMPLLWYQKAVRGGMRCSYKNK
jgi:hypothetical protein